MTEPRESPSAGAAEEEAVDRFATAVGAVAAASDDDREITLRVSDLLRRALADEELVLGCVGRALTGMPPLLDGWTNPPIVDDDDDGFSIRLIPWPGGYSNRPHEHNCWTVTGVFWNELTFQTYHDPSPGSGELELDREYRGSRGDVGSIVPPCIHQVSNPSERPSISIHVFSGPKGEDDGTPYERGRTVWYGDDGPPRPSLSLDVGSVLGMFIELLTAASGPSALGLLDRLFAVGDVPTRLEAVKGMSRKDPAHAGARLYELADQCAGDDAVRLRRIAHGLVHGRGAG